MSNSWRCVFLGHAWQPYLAGRDLLVEYCGRCATERSTTLIYAGPGAGQRRLVAPFHDEIEPAVTR